MDALAAWLPVLFAAAFPLLWVGVSLMISKMGWSRLAQQFETDALPTGRRLRIGSGSVGLASYKNVLRGHAEPDGLRLSVLFLFRVGHPPLLIPWDAIHDVEPVKAFLFRGYRLHVGRPAVQVTLPARVVEAMGELEQARAEG